MLILPLERLCFSKFNKSMGLLEYPCNSPLINILT